MQDLKGQKFNRWTVLEFSHRNGKNYYWLCECECGTRKLLQNPKSKRSVSCGCYNTEVVTKHSLNGNPLYHVFNSMKNRCYSSVNNSYMNYGGRGIKICDEWLSDVNRFIEWSNDNGYEPGLTIDRINNDGNYEPLNCRWVDKAVQSKNTRKNTFIEFEGKTLTLSEWAAIKGISPSTLCYRLYRAKWSINDALNKPVR